MFSLSNYWDDLGVHYCSDYMHVTLTGCKFSAISLILWWYNSLFDHIIRDRFLYLPILYKFNFFTNVL